jgi:GNAT superfamily N-acetyltransferase
VGARRIGNFAIRRPRDRDHDGIREFLAGLSPRSRYLRFFTGAPPASEAMVRILAGGGARTDALVATCDGVIIGHAMAADRAGPAGAAPTEIGVVVADAYQGRGVGAALVRQLVARARARGATTVVMEVLAENRQVLGMIADHWRVLREERSGAYITIWAPLPLEQWREKPWLPEPDGEPWSPGTGKQTVAAGIAGL